MTLCALTVCSRLCEMISEALDRNLAVGCCRFINGMKAQGTKLKDARIVFFGAGSSAVGVAKSIASVLEIKGGLSPEEAKKVGKNDLYSPAYPLELGNSDQGRGE